MSLRGGTTKQQNPAYLTCHYEERSDEATQTHLPATSLRGETTKQHSLTFHSLIGDFHLLIVEEMTMVDC
jgi:hypothetical protein